MAAALALVPAFIAVVPSSPAGADVLPGWYLSFPSAGWCPAPDCPATLKVALTLSVGVGSLAAAGTSTPSESAPSAVASWDLEAGAGLSLDLLKVASAHQALGTFEAVDAAAHLPGAMGEAPSSVVAAYTFTQCTVTSYGITSTPATGAGAGEPASSIQSHTTKVQVSFSCQSVTALSPAPPPVLTIVGGGGYLPSLSFPATACQAPGCLTNMADLASLSWSLPASAATGGAPVSVAASWLLDQAHLDLTSLTLGLLAMATDKVPLASFEADLGPATGSSGELPVAFSFQHCSVGLQMGSPFPQSVQETFECQSVTATLGGGPGATHVARACGTNLITNPGAEAGPATRSDSIVPVPGWKTTGAFTAVQYAWAGADLSATTPGPPDRGKNFFFGGPQSDTSTGTQVIALPSSFSVSRATYVLSGWLGGFDGQDDNATLFVTWEGAQGNPLGAAHKSVTGFPTGLFSSTQIGPVTEAQRGGTTELLYRQVSGPVPAGTSMVKVLLVMQGPDGADNDGLADNLSLVLSCS
jgi:hypothetical protein